MLVIFLVLLTLFSTVASADTVPEAGHSPKLLLTPRRLRRLQRDRERQTPRWQNFESRVRGVTDSPERGFELALYFAVTDDQQRGREAVAWSMHHPCERRQVALVLDWVGDLVAKADRDKLLSQSCPVYSDAFVRLRDDAFLGRNTANALPDLGTKPPAASDLYALAEYIDAVRSTRHVDLRETDSQFFLDLPIRFLLSMRPAQLESPSWQDHIAALALVGLDPNLESSQFLQGWGMESRFTVQDGPGVAYEFLWADPYLPGVSYQNMEPWLYDGKGQLNARSDWTENACWIAIDSAVQEQNCPAGWQSKKVVFGHLTLVPVMNHCVDVSNRVNGEATILWKLSPNATLSFEQDEEMRSATADIHGMWRATPDVHAKVCAAPKVK